MKGLCQVIFCFGWSDALKISENLHEETESSDITKQNKMIQNLHEETIEEPTVFKQILSNTPSLTELKITETMKQSLTGWWDNNGNYRGPWFDLFTGNHGLIFSRFDWDRHGNYRERRGASTDKDDKRRRASTDEDIVGSVVGDLAVGSNNTTTTTQADSTTTTTSPAVASSPVGSDSTTAPTAAPTSASIPPPAASYTVKGNGFCEGGHFFTFWGYDFDFCFQECKDRPLCKFFAVSTEKCVLYRNNVCDLVYPNSAHIKNYVTYAINV